MSVQGGVLNYEGKPADHNLVSQLCIATAQYGPDGGNSYFNGPLGMFYSAFHTTKESRLESQPGISKVGNVLTWDGRLDNRQELIPLLETDLSPQPTDIEIVLAAFERWGTECFRKLVGDWALAVWSQDTRVLTLAKDFVGSRHLYYTLTSNRVLWCTHLEPIVLLAGRAFRINEEYIAGYFAQFPAASITPYVGIQCVPPGTFVQIKKGIPQCRIYWNIDRNIKIRYHEDSEYEQHFRAVFKQAVTRRLRSDSPVLCELSGGMDSSSIVCVADAVIADGKAEAPGLNTISYYDDEEPNWNERPYIRKVEEKRLRKGFHIDLSKYRGHAQLNPTYFSAVPGIDQTILEFERQWTTFASFGGHRVLLSGIGGDEVLGGVPNPLPELADLLAHFRLMQLFRQSKAWSLTKKRPWIHLLFQAINEFFLPSPISRSFEGNPRIAPWLAPDFVERNRRAFTMEISHPRWCSANQRVRLDALSHLQRYLAYRGPHLVGCHEVRYPYLDRDLFSFLFSIPRNQILRPTQRRSLMRRALADIVPHEILHRQRKAFVIRRLLVEMEANRILLQNRHGALLVEQVGLVHRPLLTKALAEARHGESKYAQQLRRTVLVELWLRSLQEHRLF